MSGTSLKPCRRVQPILTPQYDRAAAWTRRKILVLAADRAPVLAGLPPCDWLSAAGAPTPNWLGGLAGPGQSGACPGMPAQPTMQPGPIRTCRTRPGSACDFSQGHPGSKKCGSPAGAHDVCCSSLRVSAVRETPQHPGLPRRGPSPLPCKPRSTPHHGFRYGAAAAPGFGGMQGSSMVWARNSQTPAPRATQPPAK